ncbi:MAG: ATP phosphoribosyltransferase regulatory subunit [Trueperaceae bacterium]|nr:ATP phosphoribosyltransferase regulatory subunit [Trueperaceae bacterium]
MSFNPPDGTRYVLPDAAARRAQVVGTLRDLYRAWGYDMVEVPALERYDAGHPRQAQSFKLSDRDSGVLALRSDFTPALAQLVRAEHPAVAGGARRPLRWQYSGTLWHAIDPELARTREFSQVGLELIGVSNARADAEILHLARESVRAVGLQPRLEVGNPGFVRALLDAAAVPDDRRDGIADAIDRKDRRDLADLLAATPGGGAPSGAAAGDAERARQSLLAMPDLYGGTEVLEHARAVAPWAAAQREIDRLAGVLAEFEDASELMLDLAMARRLSYYTGVTFRAYTPDYGQPLLGGGRYDGALLPAAAGFSIGVERLMQATRARAAAPEPAPRVLALDDPAARVLRDAGVRVVRALHTDAEEARAEARDLRVPFLLVAGALEPVEGVAADDDERVAITALLRGAGPIGGGA